MSRIKDENAADPEQLSQKLQACKQLIHSIMYNNRDGILVVDRDRIIRFANPAATAILGCREEELIGKRFEHPLEADKITEIKTNSRSGKTNTIEIWALKSEWDEKQAFFVTLHDITERNRLEESLRFTAAHYRALFNNNPTMIVTLDADLTMLSANPFCSSQLGYSIDELEGQPVLRLFHQDDRSAVAEQMQSCLQNPNLVKHWQFRKICKDGTLLWVEETAQAVYAYDNALNIVVVCQDITKRKQMEEEVTRLNADLTARAADLESAYMEMESFNYTVAHDLRQPLNVISSFCQVINELCGEKLDQKCMEYLQSAYDGTLRMNALIEALLQFSLLTHAELNRDRVDLSSMAKELIEELMEKESARRIKILIADGIDVDGDANLLRAVLVNLLGNALKFTAMRDEAVIEFGATVIDGKSVYYVRDNGFGFNMADAGKLFVPFQRLPGTEEYRGFGIGLATVDRIISRHGGRIWAEGEPDKGATFWFTLSAD